MYYDPVLDHNHAPNAAMGLGVAWYTLPQDPAYARQLYDAAIREARWDDSRLPIKPRSPASYRSMTLGLVLAIEFGDDVVAAKLRSALEAVAEPRPFGDNEFGYFFYLGEKWPRGQLNALLAVADVMERPGEWRAVFNDPAFSDRFSQPTVEGVDFPTVGIAQARFDAPSCTLVVETYAGDPARAGEPTSLRLSQLPPGDLTITEGGRDFDGWLRGGDGVVTVHTTVGSHLFHVQTAQPARL
mmetsp:Transcript_29165/g.76359  ORF Transcript_29165/g.76359 Transcript_29165/m.76359 type:complete len:242 (-) Transcript_29165:145-870(-)